MSKSRNRKWYDYEDDLDDYRDKKKGDDRRSKKKLKNALRSKNYQYFDQDEENDR